MKGDIDMKKVLAVVLSVALLICALAFPISAEGKEFRYYDKYVEHFGGCYEYDELYYHETNGETDWALLIAYDDDVLPSVVNSIILGRAFYSANAYVPFGLIYVVYDVAENAWYSLSDAAKSGKYDGLAEALDELDLGVKVGEPQFGDNLLYKDKYLAAYANNNEAYVQEYDELYYHTKDGAVDWALVKARSWFTEQEGSDLYNIAGGRVFRTDSMWKPFANSYAVYVPSIDAFYDLSYELTDADKSLSKLAPGLTEALDELNIGEKIGDMNRDGKINIRDVTALQRCLAEYSDFPDNDAVEAAGYSVINSRDRVNYLSDVNRDKKRDVNDVTMLQRGLAEYDTLYTGKIIINVSPDCDFYGETALKVKLYKNGYLYTDLRSVKLSTLASGSKQGVFDPAAKEIVMEAGALYKMAIGPKTGNHYVYREFVIPPDCKSNIVLYIRTDHLDS